MEKRIKDFEKKLKYKMEEEEKNNYAENNNNNDDGKSLIDLNKQSRITEKNDQE